MFGDDDMAADDCTQAKLIPRLPYNPNKSGTETLSENAFDLIEELVRHAMILGATNDSHDYIAAYECYLVRRRALVNAVSSLEKMLAIPQQRTLRF